MELRQFKLTNNEEVICEVVQWDDENTRDIVIRKAFKIEQKTNLEDNAYKYYTFSPWMAMQESLETLQTLNSDLIVAITIPSQSALNYFADIVEEVSEMQEESQIYTLESDEYEDSASEKIYLH